VDVLVRVHAQLLARVLREHALRL